MQLNKLISQSVCTQSLFGNNLSLRLISLTRSRTAASAFPVRGLSALSLVVHVVEDYHNLAAGLDTPTRTRTPPRCSRRRRIMSDAKREADSAALGEKADKRPKSDVHMSKFFKLPKVELHTHLDGSCRLTTLQEISRQRGLPFPHDNLEEFRPVVSLTSKQPSLVDFLKVFPAISQIMSSSDSVERIAYEFCEDCAKHSVVYAETRSNPFHTKEYGLGAEEFMEAVCKGLERGQRDFGVTVRQILCFLSTQPEYAASLVDVALQYAPRGVVGVDIAGEERFPLREEFVAGFKRVRESGMSITIHAGESGPADNVKQAIEIGAQRIGHGYHVVEDEEIYKMAREKGIHFEACPTSSLYTNSATIEDHALKHFAADEASFSLSTDDAGVINCNLTGEYDLAHSMGLTVDQLIKSVMNGARAAFLPAKEKEELVKSIQEKLELYRKELGE